MYELIIYIMFSGTHTTYSYTYSRVLLKMEKKGFISLCWIVAWVL